MAIAKLTFYVYTKVSPKIIKGQPQGELTFMGIPEQAIAKDTKFDDWCYCMTSFKHSVFLLVWLSVY